jgi:hypothetical protein
MIRQYNYRLETGTVGTDDENIAQILYNINQTEMYAGFASSDRKKLDDTLGKVFFLIVDAKVHLKRFMEASNGKADADTASAIGDACSAAIAAIREVRIMVDEAELETIYAVFPKVYKMLLAIVPPVLALDAQTAGRSEQERENG